MIMISMSPDRDRRDGDGCRGGDGAGWQLTGTVGIELQFTSHGHRDGLGHGGGDSAAAALRLRPGDCQGLRFGATSLRRLSQAPSRT
jgi:hypothetical protein